MNWGTRTARAGGFSHMKTLRDVVKDFNSRFPKDGGGHDPVLEYCMGCDSLQEAIDRAVDGRQRNGKIFAMGSCINKQAKKKFAVKLKKQIKNLSDFKDFEELHDLVYSLAVDVNGIGALTIYNVAARIGARREIKPRAFVYLHAGPLKGWKRLTNSRSNPLRVPVKELPAELRRLEPYRIEDLLCEYSEFLCPQLWKG